MKKIWWFVLVVILVIGAWWAYSNKTSLPGYETQNPASSSPSPTAKTVAKPAVKKITAPVAAKSYSDAVKEYEGRRIQFDDRCQVTPQNPTYKNGTVVMLDNRSASIRTVVVGGIKYDLGAYDYKIVTLSSSSLPKELVVTCGSSGNVGKILLQATILQ